MGQINLSKGTFETEGLISVSIENHPAVWLAWVVGGFWGLIGLFSGISAIGAPFSIGPATWETVTGFWSGVLAVGLVVLVMAMMGAFCGICVYAALNLVRGDRRHSEYSLVVAVIAVLVAVVAMFRPPSADAHGYEIAFFLALAVLTVVGAASRDRKTMRFRYASGAVASAGFVREDEAQRALHEYNSSKREA